MGVKERKKWEREKESKKKRRKGTKKEVKFTFKS